MELNFTSQELQSLFIEHGLKLIEQSKNIVKYTSKAVVVTMVHDPLENSNSLWIGKRDSIEVEIDDQIMNAYFYTDIKLGNLSSDAFADNVLLFFKGPGNKLLEGDMRALVDLEKFNEQRSRAYTEELIQSQYLQAADKAWRSGNYQEVIRNLEKIKADNLPESFKQKYKIAQQRLSK